MYPHVGEAMVNLFDRLDIPVTYPDGQTCCGQPAFNSGHRQSARKAALHFLQVFRDSEVIICPSGSCVHMVRHHYPQLFKDEPDLMQMAERIGDRTYELTEYLVDVLGVTDLGASFHAKTTYHDSCHLSRSLGIRRQPRALLSKVAGLELIEMENSDTCCGFGGTFSIHYPEISTAMVDEKLRTILATGAEYVTGCDISCLMHIQGRAQKRNLPVQVVHIAEILSHQGEADHAGNK